MSEPKLQLLFPTVLQMFDVEDAQRLNQQLLHAIAKIRNIEPNSKPQSWACNLYTTIGNPGLLLDHQAFADLLPIFQSQLAHYAKAHAYQLNRPPRITECWVNVYAGGDAQEIHLHKNSVFSGIYYVQVPAGAGPTLFYSPMSDVMLVPQVSESNQLNATVNGVEPVEGRMLLFRSSLRHSVLPGQFEGERVTIAFNAAL